MTETIKARIPVVVASNGQFYACGYPDSVNHPDWEMSEDCCIDYDIPEAEREIPQFARYWIEVELPLPKTLNVTGKLEPAS